MDGNEQDLRVRPALTAHSLESDNPFSDTNQICETHGTQIDYEIIVPGDGDGNSSGGTTYTYDWSDTSLVCPEGFDLRTLDRFFLSVLKYHFSLSSRIVIPELRQYVYTDDHNSKIRIVMNTVWDPTNEGSKPAIIVKRGVQQSQRQVIGDKGESDSIIDNITSYAKFIHGSHRIMCIGGSDGQTEDLAKEVFFLFTCLSPIFRDILPFHDIQTAEIGELGVIEDTGHALAVPITVSYAYEYGWKIRTIAPTLYRAILDDGDRETQIT